jgi:AcrR family transcriptional regulator
MEPDLGSRAAARDARIDEMTDRPPRGRLLAAADELFRAHGVAAVGVNRVIKRAEVAQMTLWRVFGSKQGLVDAWLRGLEEQLIAPVTKVSAAVATPRERLEAIFDVLTARVEHPAFRGCPLVNAAAEPGGAASALEVARFHKEHIRDVFVRLAVDAGLSDPDTVADQWLFLFEGCQIAGGLRLADTRAAAARAAAISLFDIASGPCADSGRRASAMPTGGSDTPRVGGTNGRGPPITSRTTTHREGRWTTQPVGLPKTYPPDVRMPD